jgi:catechol-2,3-dioxygenase
MTNVPPISGILETAVDAVDLARTAEFYRRTLGLAILLDTPRLVAFDAGSANVLLVFQAGAVERHMTDDRGTVPGHGSRGRVHFALKISADSLEAWRKRLETLGIPLTGEYRWPRGGMSLYFDDPDGNVVELATPGLWATY